jgi:hypothetical protein
MSSLDDIGRDPLIAAITAFLAGQDPSTLENIRTSLLAGPKVYSSVKRRFSSLCFGTIRTPQSSTVSSEDAVMDARTVARAARRVIEVAHQRLSLGEALLLFAEGTRSRSDGMRQLLPAASRYLQGPDTWVVPIGMTGTEALFPIGAETIHAVTVTARVGQPVPADSLRIQCGGNRRVIMDVVGLAIADLLPPKYRGFYGGPPSELIDERRLSRSLFSTRT